MPSTLNAPGIYIEERPSGVRPIVGVSTSDTAFVDWFPRGPVGEPTRVSSFDEFTRIFGGLHAHSCASYAVLQYFLNGGAIAWIVRADLAADDPATGALVDASDAATVNVSASSPGTWGRGLRVAVTDAGGSLVNVVVGELDAEGAVVVREIHRNLPSSGGGDALARAVNAASGLVRLSDVSANTNAPEAATAAVGGEPASASDYVALTGEKNKKKIKNKGNNNRDSDLQTAINAAMQTLARIEPFVFNILCIPAASTLGAALDDLVDAAATFCEQRMAFLLVDPPVGADSASASAMGSWFAGTGAPSATKNAAVYWPRLEMQDPLAKGSPRQIGPSGAVAGIYARTDSSRGVWKAPAGIEATIRGAELAVVANDADSGALNPVGVNALRTFPVVGNVVWGARTLFGADQRASEWKYVPVRRTALFIEQSLTAGLKWVVFEPNDEPLWAQIRLNVGAFMQDLFRKGAFQGTTPRDAYFVRCDKTTTTQSDIDKGVVNILVGFAPLKPAEFVVIAIQQIAGQATA